VVASSGPDGHEDADTVGLSILSGAHMTLVPRIASLLNDEGAEDVALVVGGTITNDTSTS
jgi:methylmalonyl-CoA mutase, C-terminal domain